MHNVTSCQISLHFLLRTFQMIFVLLSFTFQILDGSGCGLADTNTYRLWLIAVIILELVEQRGWDKIIFIQKDFHRKIFGNLRHWWCVIQTENHWFGLLLIAHQPHYHYYIHLFIIRGTITGRWKGKIYRLALFELHKVLISFLFFNWNVLFRLLAQTTLRNILGTKNLHEILSDRESIAGSMQVKSIFVF